MNITLHSAVVKDILVTQTSINNNNNNNKQKIRCGEKTHCCQSAESTLCFSGAGWPVGG